MEIGKLKLGIIIFVTFILGVLIGSGGSKSSTTGVTSVEKEEIKQTTTQSEKEKTPENQLQPVEEEGKVEVKSHSKKMDSGYTKIVGEVINNTSSPVEFVKVTATFYDPESEVLGSGFTYAGDTSSTPLETAATTPFEVSSYPDEFNADSYKLDVTWN